MEKLIELLNEYDWEEWLWNKREEDEQWLNNMWKIYDYHSKLKIISKEYWFIKRLVEQDKINEKKVFHFLDNSKLYEDLLCNLALSDEPIEELITYLK